MTYYEQYVLGRWTPCTTATAPQMKGDRERRGEGSTGLRIRGIFEVLPVHEVLSLSELQAAYGGKA